jgi:16S rRNA (guanine527-N7)-methyltransferase
MPDLKPTKEMNLTPPGLRFHETLINESAKYGVVLETSQLDLLNKYYELLQNWNQRLHLVGPCSPEEFATRHILESLILLKHLTPAARVVEVGSGAGLPIMPCLLARSDLSATLIEAAQKKSVFLREAIRHTGISQRATVVNRRFEAAPPPAVDFVTCRALERFDNMLPTLLTWAPAATTLMLFGAQRLSSRIRNLGFEFETELVPQSKSRYLYIVKKN